MSLPSFLARRSGSYLQAFILSGVLCLIAAVCVLQIGQSPTKEPRKNNLNTFDGEVNLRAYSKLNWYNLF